jgi:hypothetical protein
VLNYQECQIIRCPIKGIILYIIDYTENSNLKICHASVTRGQSTYCMEMTGDACDNSSSIWKRNSSLVSFCLFLSPYFHASLTESRKAA